MDREFECRGRHTLENVRALHRQQRVSLAVLEEILERIKARREAEKRHDKALQATEQAATVAVEQEEAAIADALRRARLTRENPTSKVSPRATPGRTHATGAKSAGSTGSKRPTPRGPGGKTSGTTPISESKQTRRGSRGSLASASQSAAVPRMEQPSPAASAKTAPTQPHAIFELRGLPKGYAESRQRLYGTIMALHRQLILRAQTDERHRAAADPVGGESVGDLGLLTIAEVKRSVITQLNAVKKAYKALARALMERLRQAGNPNPALKETLKRLTLLRCQLACSMAQVTRSLGLGARADDLYPTAQGVLRGVVGEAGGVTEGWLPPSVIHATQCWHSGADGTAVVRRDDVGENPNPGPDTNPTDSFTATWDGGMLEPEPTVTSTGERIIGFDSPSELVTLLTLTHEHDLMRWRRSVKEQLLSKALPTLRTNLESRPGMAGTTVPDYRASTMTGADTYRMLHEAAFAEAGDVPFVVVQP
eukprot:Clim_evm31s218 gene=Clim_evmTU31s218